MLRKVIFSTIAAAALGATVFASTAYAGGYGYGNNHGGGYVGHGGGYGGYQQHHNYNKGRGRNWQQHVDWCSGRYNTYRAQDNSYQPYSGARQQCRSPYHRG